jgi:hypothetical protein
MTQLLQKAFEAAGRLSPDAQDALARALLYQLESEKGWDTAFQPAEADTLASLADAAIDEYRQGTSKPLDLSDL